METGFAWSRADVMSADVWIDLWGDGKVYLETSTNWDDGNFVDGDGWSHNWVIEYGWVWNGGNQTTKDVWYAPWGNSIFTNTEEWDDGNIINGDGWNSHWKIESDWYWISSAATIPNSKWSEYWGDGKNLGILDWDDGNVLNGDGWDSTCSVEHGYTWSGGSNLK